MASGRDTSPSCLLAHSSIRANNEGSTRTPINFPLPIILSGPRLLPFGGAFFAFAIWPSVQRFSFGKSSRISRNSDGPVSRFNGRAGEF